jgi:hypothetical protein
MSVVSESNKQILWEVLNGMIDGNNLEIQNINQFREFFEIQCKNYHAKRFDYNGLSEINKLIVSGCFQYLTKMSQDSKLIMFRDYEKYGNKNLAKSLEIGKRYDEHESNFKKLMNNKKPGDIDFSENADEPIGNMENVLSQTMEQRESELSNIRQKYDTNDSIKWLNSGGVPKLKIHDNEQIKLEISEKRQLNQPEQKSKEQKSKEQKSKEQKSKEQKSKEQKPKKKVKFKSEIALEDKKDVNTMDEYFNLMNDGMNKDIREREKDINLKNSVIKEVERRDKLEEEKNEESKNVNLNNFFDSMKVKTKDSDVYAAKTDVMNKRIDKLETYLFDVLNNQIKILEKLDNLQPKTRDNMFGEDEILAAI